MQPRPRAETVRGEVVPRVRCWMLMSPTQAPGARSKSSARLSPTGLRPGCRGRCRSSGRSRRGARSPPRAGRAPAGGAHAGARAGALGAGTGAHQRGVAAYVADRHARAPQAVDQLDPPQVGLLVAAVSGGRSPDGREQQPVALVVAQGVGGEPGELGGAGDRARRRPRRRFRSCLHGLPWSALQVKGAGNRPAAENCSELDGRATQPIRVSTASLWVQGEKTREGQGHGHRHRRSDPRAER